MTRDQLLGRALRVVIGGRLRQSKLGEVWHDDRTWVELAKELVSAAGSQFVFVDKRAYAKLFADAQQMRLIRKNIAEYKSKLSESKKKEAEKNPYARWASEHMKDGDGKT